MSDRRAGSRAARRAQRTVTKVDMLPSLRRNLPLCESMDDKQIRRIDTASMDILEEVGVVFRDPAALADWRKAGADVRDETVHLDRGLVRDLIATISSTITYHARNPEKNVRLGGPHSIFVPMTGAPYIRDLEDKRRLPTLDDLATFHELAHMSPALHSSAYHIVEPMDHVVSHRHLRITYSSMKCSDKTFMGMTTSPKNAEDVLDMCAILFGEDFLETHAIATGNCNGNSPLVWDETMLGAMRAFSRRNPAGAVLAFRAGRCQHTGLGGAGGGATQCRGAVGAGLYPSDPPRRTHHLRALPVNGVHAVGGADGRHTGNQPHELHDRPDGTLLRRALADLQPAGRRQDLRRPGGGGYESAATLSAVLYAGAHYIWHSAGWNEAGMHCSIAKFIVDAGQCAMGYRMAESIRWDDFDEAVAAVRDIGPGGHYLGHPHTQDNFERAFFMPQLFDNNSIEQWQAEGSVEITERALRRANKLLSEYEEPKLDPALDEALRDYIARREREIPAEDALNQEY